MSFDGWVILVIIIGVIGAGVSLVIAEDAARTRREFITGSISLWLIGYTVIAGLTCFGTSNARPSPPWKEAAPNAKIAEQLGLVSGTQYDLVLGGRTGGSSGSTSTTAISGLFSARATASSSSSPASAISLGYTVGEKTYILEVPTARTTFIQSETDKPSVTIWLGGSSGDFGHTEYVDTYPYSSCEWRFHNLLPLCMWPDYDKWEPKLIVEQSTHDVGLAPLVSAGFDRAEITLTPEMYRQLLGIIE
jgi:hypothetical protein